MSTRLNVTIVTSDVPNYRIPFLRELGGQGAQVHVVAAGELGQGFVVDGLPPGVSISRLQRRKLPGFRLDVVRDILTSAPDVIVCEHASRHDYVWTTLVAPQLRRIPRVLWTHGVARQEVHGKVRDMASIGRWLQVDLADAVLCYEAYGAALVRAARPHKLVSHINNSTDGFELRARIDLLKEEGRGAVRTRLGLRRDAAVFCGLGRLVGEKEFARLIPILAQVRSIGIDAQLLLIGGGPERDKLERAASDAGLHEHVIFAGPVRGADELAPWLFASDASVSPSAVGLSVVDGLFAGLPMITPIPGIAGPHHGPEYHYLEPGRTGLVAAGNSDDALAATLIEFFTMSSTAREAISAACVDFAMANLGVARMASAMTDFLGTLVRASEARRQPA